MRWVFAVVGGLGILYFMISFMNAFSHLTGYSSGEYSRATAMNTAVIGLILIIGFGVVISEMRRG